MRYVVVVDFRNGDTPTVYPFEKLVDAQRFMKDLWEYYYDDTTDDDERVTYVGESEYYACMTEKNGDCIYFNVIEVEEPSIDGLTFASLQNIRRILSSGYGSDSFKEASRDCVYFYYKCLAGHMGLIDADKYAVLNTLLGYDIGMDASRRINSKLREKGLEVLEFNANDESKQYIKEAALEAGVDLDFSGWLTEPYEEYSYFKDSMV